MKRLIRDSKLEDIALLSKKYKTYLRLKKENNSNPNFKSNDLTKNKCHMRRKNKKNAMKATWVGSSESEFKNEDQDRIFNICFTTIDGEVKSLELNDESSDDELDDLSYKELLNDFNDLHKNYEKLFFKNGAIKKKISSLSKRLKIFKGK